MSKGKKAMKSSGFPSGSMMLSSHSVDYFVESKASDTLSPEKLVSMGIVDLRMTRPPKPAGAPPGVPVKGKALEDEYGGGARKDAQKTEYQELQNSSQLVDEPPPPAKVRRVNAASLKADKEREIFGEGGEAALAESAGAKDKEGSKKKPAAFANLDSDGIRRLRAMLVNFCKKEDGTFFKEINLRQYGMDSGQLITNGVVQELCTVQSDMIKLNLEYCDMISDVGLWAIARHCRKIEHLVLTKCDQITNVGLRSLSLSCSNMTTLDFNHCHLLDDIALTVIATGAWKLQHLLLQDCVSITDNGVGRVAKAGATLKTLDLYGCTNVGEFGDRAIKEIGAFCGSLQYLDIGGCRRVEDGGLRALAVGCPHIETLKLGGCKILTKDSLKALSRHSREMTDLLLGGCEKFCDADFEQFLNPQCVFSTSLTSLDLSGCSRITDRGVAVVCKTFGLQLSNLGLSGSNITDFSSDIVTRLCLRIRTLDLSNCPNISDTSIHTVARGITGLTTLKLDNCHRINTKTLIGYVGAAVAEPLEFCDMANKWLGFQPKPNVAGLIVAREIFRLHSKNSIKIQCLVRRKFAYKRYAIRRKWYLMTKIVPRIQARIRGMIQRIKFSSVKHHIMLVKRSVVIQRTWRKFVAIQKRLRLVKLNAFSAYKQAMAIRIQKRRRGMLGRRNVIDLRNAKMNAKFHKARRIMAEEKGAVIVQRTILAFLGRVEATKRIDRRNEFRRRKALEERMMRTVQRLCRGRIGRNRANTRRKEIAHAHLRWTSVLLIQRNYRGLLGRRRYRKFLAEFIARLKFKAAQLIQKIYRGYRGKVIGIMLKQLKKLRLRKSAAAVRIQCLVRGIIARAGVEHYKKNIVKDKIRKKAIILIQKIFRGHKGREARAIEKELRVFEAKAKPLIDLIKRLEEESLTQAKTIARVESVVKRSEEDLFVIERELAMCMATTSKYCDSARINNTPQRFLTKYLRVRLKDHFEHEKALHFARQKELTKRKGSCRGFDVEIMMARRELLPLTTGVVIHVKKERTKVLRARVRGRQMSAKKIQALWRGAITRVYFKDPQRDYWVECHDLEQSDKPYYYNTWTEATEWKMPMVFRLFGGRGKKEEDDGEIEDDDD